MSNVASFSTTSGCMTSLNTSFAACCRCVCVKLVLLPPGASCLTCAGKGDIPEPPFNIAGSAPGPPCVTLYRDCLFLAACATTNTRAALPSKFLQSTHLQFSPHVAPAWKHSQYFFRQPLFLQLHPLLCRAGAATSSIVPATLGLNALGLRSNTASTAPWRTSSFALLLQQSLQLQLSQYTPDAKHSQYSFKHLEFLQLHCFRLAVARGPRELGRLCFTLGGGDAAASCAANPGRKNAV